jgi:predicted enzyme related to lactoylglutathione lyase
MSTTNTLRGMATVSFWADDVPAAAAWYGQLLGVEPYFVRPTAQNPQYIEFRLGDYQHELGIISSDFKQPDAPTQPGGAVLYWHVDDVQVMLDKVIAMGATAYQPLVQREAGFVTASVLDPFGNILGLMQNPHYLEMLSGMPKA